MYNLILVNLDTDSLSVCKPDGTAFSKEERDGLLTELNSLMPKMISWEDDGYYPSVVVIKAKNYCLLDEKGKQKIKGSALKATMKEPALQEFIKTVIEYLLNDKQDQLQELYFQYIRDIHNLTDIYKWASKKTLTAAVLNPERTNEQKVFDAIQGTELQEGDKFFVYFQKDGKLKLPEKWDKDNPDHDTENLMKKLYSTLEVFETIINMDLFPKFHLKSHNIKCQLADVLGMTHPEKIKKPRKKKLLFGGTGGDVHSSEE